MKVKYQNDTLKSVLIIPLKLNVINSIATYYTCIMMIKQGTQYRGGDAGGWGWAALPPPAYSCNNFFLVNPAPPPQPLYGLKF